MRAGRARQTEQNCTLKSTCLELFHFVNNSGDVLATSRRRSSRFAQPPEGKSESSRHLTHRSVVEDVSCTVFEKCIIVMYIAGCIVAARSHLRVAALVIIAQDVHYTLSRRDRFSYPSADTLNTVSIFSLAYLPYTTFATAQAADVSPTSPGRRRV